MKIKIKIFKKKANIMFETKQIVMALWTKDEQERNWQKYRKKAR